MKEETVEMINRLKNGFKRVKDPTDGFTLSLHDADRVEATTNSIIEIFEKERMTYEEAYAILNFTYETLEYKSTKVNL